MFFATNVGQSRHLAQLLPFFVPVFGVCFSMAQKGPRPLVFPSQVRYLEDETEEEVMLDNVRKQQKKFKDRSG